MTATFLSPSFSRCSDLHCCGVQGRCTGSPRLMSVPLWTTPHYRLWQHSLVEWDDRSVLPELVRESVEVASVVDDRAGHRSALRVFRAADVEPDARLVEKANRRRQGVGTLRPMPRVRSDRDKNDDFGTGFCGLDTDLQVA